MLSWLLCAAACIGIGALLLRGLWFSCSLTNALWSGLALILAFLQLYHFLRPIDGFADFFLLAAAAVGWIWNARLLFARIREIFKTQWGVVLVWVPAAFLLAFRAAGPCQHYDTGFYGAQAIRWFSSYPLLPGLANLQGQYGFNSSVFLWIAALGQGPWTGLAHHFFVSYLLAAFLAFALSAGLRVIRARNGSASDWFVAILFLPATSWAITGMIVGTNTDLPTSIVCLVAAALLFRASENGGLALGQEAAEKVSRQADLVIAMVLFSLAVTFKLSSILFAALCWLLALAKLWQASKEGRRRKPLLVWAVVLSALLVVPWICRGLVLSGYAFFPDTKLSIQVDWKVSAGEAEKQADIARSYARVQFSEQYAHGWQWLKPWFKNMASERKAVLIPLCLIVVGAIMRIAGTAKNKSSAGVAGLWLLLPAFAGLVFWFLEAPAVRFGEPLLWTAAATLGALAAQRWLDTQVKIRVGLAGLVVLIVWASHPRLLWASYFRASAGERTLSRLPEPKLVMHRTASGFELSVPVETDQCWDAPLPCSPYFHETLRLRRPGDFSSGFTAQEGPESGAKK